jgi:hypothetical protein
MCPRCEKKSTLLPIADIEITTHTHVAKNSPFALATQLAKIRTKTGAFIFVCFFIIIVFITILKLGKPSEDRPRDVIIDRNRQTTPVDSAISHAYRLLDGVRLPSDVKINVLNYSNYNRESYLELELSRKISLSNIESIATTIRSRVPKDDYLKIYYTLAFMVPRGFMWAHSHYVPTPMIGIYGLTDTEASKLLNAPMPQHDKLIGSWIHESRYGYRITYIELDGKIKGQCVNHQGNIELVDLTARSVQDGIVYERITSDSNVPIGYWEKRLVDRDGELRNFDGIGQGNTATSEERWVLDRNFRIENYLSD